MSTSSDNQLPKKKRSLAETPAREGDVRFQVVARYKRHFYPEDEEIMKNMNPEESLAYMDELIKQNKFHLEELPLDYYKKLKPEKN